MFFKKNLTTAAICAALSVAAFVPWQQIQLIQN